MTTKKTRTWLLYVMAAVFVVSAGVLMYRIIDRDTLGEEIVYNDGSSSTIEGSDYYAAIDRTHGFIDSWAGSHSGGVAEWVMTDVITHNKKYPDEPIQVIFGNINCGANINCITEKKKNLNDISDYEVSYEYNKEGYVYQVRFSNNTSPFNYLIFVPMIIVVVFIAFVFIGIIRSARTMRRVKGIIDNRKDDDEY